jgi:hypothetical protein
VCGTLLPNLKIAQPVQVTSFTDYQRQFGGFRRDSFLTYAAQAFFQNGGRRLYIVRIVGKGPASPPSPPGGGPASAAASPGSLLPMKISALTQGLWGNQVSVTVSPSSDGDGSNFKLTVLYGPSGTQVPVETYDRVTFNNSGNLLPGAPNPADYVFSAVNTRSEYIAFTDDVTSRPTNSALDANNKPIPTFLVNGSDGPPALPSDFIGLPAADNTVTGTGLFALDKITDVNIIRQTSPSVGISPWPTENTAVAALDIPLISGGSTTLPHD